MIALLVDLLLVLELMWRCLAFQDKDIAFNQWVILRFDVKFRLNGYMIADDCNNYNRCTGLTLTGKADKGSTISPILEPVSLSIIRLDV